MPARIGDILLKEGLVAASDIEEALSLARERRMRVASALVTLGRLGADAAARALARQHGVPAALQKHLSGRDVTLAELLPAQLAWSLGALPIASQRGSGSIVVCVRDPIPSATVTLERAIGKPIVLAVAAEIVLLPLIAEAYPVAAEAVPFEIDIDVDTESGAIETPVPDSFSMDNIQLVELDADGVAKDHSLTAMPLPTSSPTGQFLALGTDPGLKRQTGPQPAIAPPPRMLALDPALVAINAAETRDQVIDALLAYLRHRFQVGVVFVCKDGLALGQSGFGNDVAPESISALTFPLSSPSVLRLAYDRGASYVGPPIDRSIVQDRFLKLFGAPPAKLVVVPVVINKRVVNLVYGHGPRNATLEDAATELGTLASAAEDAFVRIIRESKA